MSFLEYILGILEGKFPHCALVVLPVKTYVLKRQIDTSSFCFHYKENDFFVHGCALPFVEVADFLFEAADELSVDYACFPPAVRGLSFPASDSPSSTLPLTKSQCQPRTEEGDTLLQRF